MAQHLQQQYLFRHRWRWQPAGEGQLSTRVTANPKRVLGLTVIDQGASSLSNFALAGIVAHFSGAHRLGIYAILASTYIIAQGLVRSCTSDCMLTRSETDDTIMAQWEQSGYLSALVASIAVAIIVALIAVILSHAFFAPMFIFALGFPFMALQDYSRYIGISRHDPGYAVRLDSIWVLLFIIFFYIGKKTGHLSLPWLMGEWVISGGLIGLWTARTNLVLRNIRKHLRFWVKSEASIGWKFAGQFLLTTSWSYIIFFLLVFFLSVNAIGVLKLATLALGPLSVASVGLQSAMISMAAKRFPIDPMKTLRFILAVATGTAAATVGWTALIYLLPAHALRVFGPAWPQARSIVVYIGISYTFAAWYSAGATALRALRAAKENLWLAVALLPFLFLPPLMGAWLDGLRGAAIGWVVSNIFILFFTWIVVIHVARRGKVLPPSQLTLDVTTLAAVDPQTTV